MNEEMVFALGRNALQITLLLALPILAVSLIVGVVIGIVQAATQIHEATLSFVPKVLVMVLVMALLGPWMLQNMVQFTIRTFELLPTLVR